VSIIKLLIVYFIVN